MFHLSYRVDDALFQRYVNSFYTPTAKAPKTIPVKAPIPIPKGPPTTPILVPTMPPTAVPTVAVPRPKTNSATYEKACLY